MDIRQIQSDHDVLLARMAALRDLVAAGAAANAVAICAELAALGATLRLHLAIEDNLLYPALARAHDAEVASAGRHFQQEMGGLADDYAAFTRRWCAADDIAAAPERFRQDLETVLGALDARIAREHATLLPLAAAL
ncbi:hemerythrin domain-containing protein [Thermomonas sp.]|uniref:hemerythrin domain-containing protein n=1 Tax=Thermomonas sp. TaxID=1971895 RepID=UPI0035B35340